MARWTSVEQAGTDFPALLDLVVTNKEPVVIEGAGGPVAVLVSPEDFDRLKAHLWEAVDRLRGGVADRDPEEVEREVAQVVEEMRRERHEQRHSVAESRR